MSYTANNPNGQAAMANSAPVVIANNQSPISITVGDGGDAALGAKTDTAATSDTGTFSEIALHKRELDQMVKARDVDNTPLTNTKPGIVGGKAIDVTAPTPFTAGDAVIDVHDSATGAKVVLQGDLNSVYDNVTITESFVTAASQITRPANTTIYAVNDVIGSLGQLLNVSSGTSNGKDNGGYITSIGVFSNDAGLRSTNIKLVIFDGSGAALSGVFSDNAAYTESVAIATVALEQLDLTLSPCIGSSTDSKYYNNNLRIPYKTNSNTTSLYYVLVTTSGFTPSANSTQVNVRFTVTKNV